jgi:hypothetical protein
VVYRHFLGQVEVESEHPSKTQIPPLQPEGLFELFVFIIGKIQKGLNGGSKNQTRLAVDIRH